jgi:transcriptional regulator with XRE-family HTH domain
MGGLTTFSGTVTMPQEATVLPGITAEYLKSLREKAGITQKDLAAEMKISRAMVIAIETGRRRPTDDMQTKWVTTVRAIAKKRAEDVEAI